MKYNCLHWLICLQFSKKYDLLAECHLKLGKHNLAMETVAKCLLVDVSQLSVLAEKWVKIKLDLRKTRPESSLLKRLVSIL